jgi:hypothetical protein
MVRIYKGRVFRGRNSYIRTLGYCFNILGRAGGLPNEISRTNTVVKLNNDNLNFAILINY